MKIKSEKGYTGIDIAVSVIVIFIFVSLIATLFYNINSASKEIELKSEATSIAISEIENMKNMNFTDIANRSVANGNSQYIPTDTTKQTEEVEGKSGFYRTVIIQDYSDINTNKIPGLIKKVTVQIKYMFKGKEQTLELSTIISK